MPKVSIIIPFNNVEEYINECLDSVVNQKLKDIEIICVNDASDDNSRKIVEKYAQEDDRIKIIDIDKRKGQGFARNRAIEIATGEYIGFVDSDDYIEPDMFLNLYAKAKLNDNDIVICQAREYDDINEKFILSDYYSLDSLSHMGNKVFSAKDIKDQLLELNVVLWNKIYKKSYLDSIGEKFPEGYIYEDLPFFFGTFLPAKKIQIVWKNLYIYRINRKNSTMQQFNNKILDRPDMVSLTFEKLKKFDSLSDILDKVKGWIINDLFHRYTLLKENFQREYFFKMKKVFQNLDIEDIENPFWKKIYHFDGYLMVLNNDFETFNQKIFTEYLDIHMLENRLRSELCSFEALEENFTKIYAELWHNKEYAESFNLEENIPALRSDIKKNQEIVDLLQNNINTALSELKNTISEESENIYEEIAFNHDKIIEICESKIHEVEEEIKEKVDYSQVLFDEKITKVHFSINQEISNIYGDNKKNYESLTDLIEKSVQAMRQNINNEEELRHNRLDEKIVNNKQDIKDELKQQYSLLNEKIEIQIKNQRENYEQEIKELKMLFEMMINEQKNNYENQINQLKDRIIELEKTPIQKLKEKIKKNR